MIALLLLLGLVALQTANAADSMADISLGFGSLGSLKPIRKLVPAHVTRSKVVAIESGQQGDVLDVSGRVQHVQSSIQVQEASSEEEESTTEAATNAPPPGHSKVVFIPHDKMDEVNRQTNDAEPVSAVFVPHEVLGEGEEFIPALEEVHSITNSQTSGTTQHTKPPIRGDKLSTGSGTMAEHLTTALAKRIKSSANPPLARFGNRETAFDEFATRKLIDFEAVQKGRSLEDRKDDVHFFDLEDKPFLARYLNRDGTVKDYPNASKRIQIKGNIPEQKPRRFFQRDVEPKDDEGPDPNKFCPDEFTCRDSCELTYKDGCPYNCNCGPTPKCPRVKCPRPEPDCLVLTLLDGCQTCGCRDPVVLLTDRDGNQQALFVRFTYLPDGVSPEQVGVKLGDGEGLDFQSLTVHNKLPGAEQIPRSVFESALNVAHKEGGTLLEAGDKLILVETIPVYGAESDGHGCTDDIKKEVRRVLHYPIRLLNQYRQFERDAVLSFPQTYRLENQDVVDVCKDWHDLMAELGDNRAKCSGNFRLLDELLAAFHYPCGSGSFRHFLRQYPCVRNVMGQSAAAECFALAQDNGEDPFLNRCDTHDHLAECLADHVHDECGGNGWEMLWQHMRMAFRQLIPGCKIRRVFGQEESEPTAE